MNSLYENQEKPQAHLEEPKKLEPSGFFHGEKQPEQELARGKQTTITCRAESGVQVIKTALERACTGCGGVGCREGYSGRKAPPLSNGAQPKRAPKQMIQPWNKSKGVGGGHIPTDRQTD